MQEKKELEATMSILDIRSPYTPNISTISMPMKGNNLWGNKHLLTYKPWTTEVR